MDWSNETYVRLYIRDTATWLKMRWQGECLLMQLLRKVDRSGRMDGIVDPVDDLSLVTGLPEDIVKAGLKKLQKYGVVEINEEILIIPNYIEAQTASKSDKQRQRESREGRRLAAIDAASRNVTVTHNANVTRQNAQSDPSPDTKNKREGVPPKKTKKVKTALPDDWAPNEKHGELAKEHGVILVNECAKFRDYALGANWKKADWDATFRNWIRKAGEYAQNGATARPQYDGLTAAQRHTNNNAAILDNIERKRGEK